MIFNVHAISFHCMASLSNSFLCTWQSVCSGVHYIMTTGCCISMHSDSNKYPDILSKQNTGDAFYGIPQFTAVQRNLPLDLILSQMNPVNIPTPYFLQIHFSLIIITTLKTYKWSVPFFNCILKFCVQFSSLSKACYMPYPSARTHARTHTQYHKIVVNMNMVFFRGNPDKTDFFLVLKLCDRHPKDATGPSTITCEGGRTSSAIPRHR